MLQRDCTAAVTDCHLDLIPSSPSDAVVHFVRPESTSDDMTSTPDGGSGAWSHDALVTSSVDTWRLNRKCQRGSSASRGSDTQCRGRSPFRYTSTSVGGALTVRRSRPLRRPCPVVNYRRQRRRRPTCWSSTAVFDLVCM